MSKVAKSVFARSLSVCRQMKNNFFRALLFLIFLSISCASADKLQNQDQEHSEVQTGSEPAPVELKKKKSLADEIIVRDIYSKEEYPLSKIAQKRIVFIELSASLLILFFFFLFVPFAFSFVSSMFVFVHCRFLS